MKQSVVVAQGDTAARLEAGDPVAGWKLLFAVGVAITVLGFLDIGLVFYHATFSSLQWEFGAVSTFFQSQAVPAIGIGAMCAAAVANGWTGARRALAILSLLMALAVIAAAIVLVLDVPVLLKGIADAGFKESVKLAGIRSSLFAVIYLALYLALGVWTWRRRSKTS